MSEGAGAGLLTADGHSCLLPWGNGPCATEAPVGAPGHRGGCGPGQAWAPGHSGVRGLQPSSGCWPLGQAPSSRAATMGAELCVAILHPSWPGLDTLRSRASSGPADPGKQAEHTAHHGSGPRGPAGADGLRQGASQLMLLPEEQEAWADRGSELHLPARSQQWSPGQGDLPTVSGGQVPSYHPQIQRTLQVGTTPPRKDTEGTRWAWRPLGRGHQE